MAQRTVCPYRVVLLPPSLRQNLCLQRSIEDLSIQKLVSQFPVKGFNESILPRTAGRDEQCLHANPSQPLTDSESCKLRPILSERM